MSEIKLSEELKEESKRNATFFKVLGFPDIIFDIQALEAEIKGLKADEVKYLRKLTFYNSIWESKYQKKLKEADKLMMSTKIELVDKFQAMEAENKRLKEGLKVIENHAYQYGKGEPYFLGIQRIFEKRKLKFTNGQ